MALSITTTTGLSNGLFMSERTVSRSDSEDSAERGGALTADDAAPSTRESASERPVRETQRPGELTPEERSQVAELQRRDRQVRAHEQAHKAAAGQYVTGGSFSYQTGPDGRRYAIGGEVSINASGGRTPEETLRKAEQIRRAALAPADPSSQDRRVAAQATAMAAEARSEIGAQRRAELQQNRQAMQENQVTTAEDQVKSATPLGRRAIASFTAIGGGGSLHSEPQTVDEII